MNSVTINSELQINLISIIKTIKINMMFRGGGELDNEASVKILKEKNAYYEEIKDYTMKHTSQ